MTTVCGAAGLRCVMFKRHAYLLDFSPAEGQKVEIRGRLAVYEARGELQVVVEALRKVGAGTLILTGANTLTNGIALNGGWLVGTVAGAFGPAANTVTFGGGNLEMRAAATSPASSSATWTTPKIFTAASWTPAFGPASTPTTKATAPS